MSSVLFFDPTCQKPYSRRTLMETALAGTDSTVVRLAERLDARVMQHNRELAEERYLPPAPARDVEHLVILREPRVVRTLSERYPGARVYLWLHDLLVPGTKRARRLAAAVPTLAGLAATILCVSEFQRRQVRELLNRVPGGTALETVTLYNPLEDGLAPNGAPVEAWKLVFFSSPNKGLAFTLDAFRALHRQMPELRLRVASPGYKSLRRARLERVDGRTAAVEWLGPLPHARALDEVRSALCVFYPNFVFPESFGLVLAEANAVGTPVLTHDCGAAGEVLADPRQLLPVTPGLRLYECAARLAPSGARRILAPLGERLGLFAPYVERIAAWQRGERPQTQPDPRFHLSAVAERWRALFVGNLTGPMIGAPGGRAS